MNDMTAPILRWARAFADDVTSGTVDFLEVVEMAVEELEQELELCPACVSRPIRPKTTAGRDGQCGACHLRHLAEAHREKLAEIEAWQEQATAKKALQRLRDASGDDLPADLAAIAEYSHRRGNRA